MTQQTRLRHSTIPWIVAALGAVAAIAVFIGLHRAESQRIERDFEDRSRNLGSNLKQVAASYCETLHTLRDLFHFSEEVTRTEFALAASDLQTRHAGVVAYFWAPRVDPSDVAAFEEKVGTDTQTDFRIYPAPDHASDTGLRSDRFPILFVNPYGIARLEGYDLSHSPAWPLFIQAARDSLPRLLGRPAFLPPEVRDDTSLLAIPVYVDSVPTSESERLQRLRGFVLALTAPGAMLAQAAEQMQDHQIEVILVEHLKPGEARVLQRLGPTSSGLSAAPVDFNSFRSGLSADVPVAIGGGTWELVCRPSAAWLAKQHTSRALLTSLLTFLFGILVAVYLHLLFRRTAAIEATVSQRTLELTAAQRELEDDVRRRIQTEQALKASEERYRTLLRQSADAIWRLEFDDPVSTGEEPEHQVAAIMARARVAECNEPAAKVHGHPAAGELIGKDLLHLAPHSRERQQQVLTAFVRNRHRLFEYEASEVDGNEERIFLHNLFGVVEADQLLGIWITERELTARRRMEQERQNFERRLADSQRLESLGVLAGGIAHDFNNLLTGILGHASLGRSELPSESHLHEHFEQIENASRSAAGLCQQMLAYAGKGQFVLRPVRLSKVVADTTHLMQASISKQAELHIQVRDDLPAVLADATQLQQIIMNLVVNASEAIGRNPGVITLTTGLFAADEGSFEACAFAPEDPVASYVFLEVKDTGPGMPPAVLNRIFEPFFTTKFAGRGLGLAATIGIVRRHNGALRVASQPGAGTTFTLYLPVPPDQPPEETRSTASNSPWNAEGTLLVIDDEEPVRHIAERIARSLGFIVVSAPDGIRGLELFERHRSDISVVLLDLSMPGMPGEELLQRIRSLSPDTNVVVMSGYNQPSLPLVSGARPPIFLSKPFNISQFQTAIRHAMRRPV